MKRLQQKADTLDFNKVWILFQETDKKFQETREQMQETDRRIEKLSKMVSGLGINLGEIAEVFFKEALENMSEIWGIKYEHVDSFSRKTKKLQGEYDIVLFNGNDIIVVEVKQKLHPDDVDDFYSRRLPNFSKLFPEYTTKKKVIGAVAALKITEAAAKKAAGYGFLIITQNGQTIKVTNKKGFVPVRY